MNILLQVLISAIVSILFGSVTAALVSHFLTSYRADREYRLKKLEELYLAVAAAGRNLWANYHHILEVAEGAVKWDEATDKANAYMIEFQREYSTAMMIANVYFPCLVHIVDRLMDLETNLKPKKFAFREIHEAWVPSPFYESTFDQALQDVKTRQEEACEKIVETSEDVRRGGLIVWLRTRFFT